MASLDIAETAVLAVANGQWNRRVLAAWLTAHLDSGGFHASQPAHNLGQCRRRLWRSLWITPALGISPDQLSSTRRPRGVSRTRSVRP